VNCGLEIDYSRPSGPLDLAFFLTNQGMSPRASFLSSSEGNETTFGDAMCSAQEEECTTYLSGDSGDYHLVVRHFGQDAWDTSMGGCYTWTIRAAAAAGCPASCPTVTNNLCVCMQ
jgi:hypothetical protein